MLSPRLDILPSVQRLVWPQLAEVPKHFVLYGGTGLAVRLGHRVSIDFDFFTSEAFAPQELLNELAVLRGAKVLQESTQTLSVSINERSPVKISFFGGLTLGRVGEPERTADNVVYVGSLLDVAGTKAAVVYQRAEAKDYIDILALTRAGVTLPMMLSAAQALYRERYNPLLTIKALTHFSDGDLHKLSSEQQRELVELAAKQPFDLPPMERLSDRLSPGV